MPLRFLVAVALASLALAAAPDARAAEPVPNAAAEGATCVSWEPRVVYGALGYDHRVALRNGCEKTARCTVTTDANPEPQTTTLPPGESTVVVTYRGSPAREFTATVRCQLEG